MRITYIGHATLLLEIAGVRVLTDPNFDPHLGRFLPRVSAPGIALDALPKLDALLLTHAHADHLSFDSLDRLPRDVPLYAPPAVARWLQKRGYAHAVPLAPGESAVVGPAKLSAAAAKHLGARYGVDRWRSAANMYLLDAYVARPAAAGAARGTGDGSGTARTAARVTCFFAGDTALTPDSDDLVKRELHDRARPLDVALLPIGHPPWWKMKGFRKGHLTSDDALELSERLAARYFIPYHWGTFDHVTSKAHDAIDVLRARIPEHARGKHVRIVEPGETFELTIEDGKLPR